jgi:hypothetical protein
MEAGKYYLLQKKSYVNVIGTRNADNEYLTWRVVDCGRGQERTPSSLVFPHWTVEQAFDILADWRGENTRYFIHYWVESFVSIDTKYASQRDRIRESLLELISEVMFGESELRQLKMPEGRDWFIMRLFTDSISVESVSFEPRTRRFSWCSFDLREFFLPPAEFRDKYPIAHFNMRAS